MATRKRPRGVWPCWRLRGPLLYALVLASLVSLVALLSAVPEAAAASAGAGPVFPQPVGYVTDQAGVLSPAARASLEEDLARFEKSSGIQLAVVTVKSVAPLDSKMYAVQLFSAWGIGKKGKDNGVLLLLAQQERRVEIEVGYGLEPVLTDGRAGEILDRYVVPALRRGDYDAGLAEGARAIMRVLQGQPGGAPEGQRQASGSGSGVAGWALLVLFLCFVLAIALGGWGSSGGGGSGSLRGGRRPGRTGWPGMPGPWGGGRFGGPGGKDGFGGFGGGSSGGGGAGRGF
ncbi:MAG: TPM domain-containing protein [Firmicutes bacterium]|nr:TPM domain-containing protein [Bacillota bacterium]